MRFDEVGRTRAGAPAPHELDQGYVDAIGGCAAHDAGDDHEAAAPNLTRPTCSLSSHTWRESLSSFSGVGAGRPALQRGRLFLEGQHAGRGFRHPVGKFAVALRFLNHGFVGARDVLLDMTDQAQVAAGADMLDGCLLDRSGF